jgi:pro-sigmaK processing inhibitor BofA
MEYVPIVFLALIFIVLAIIHKLGKNKKPLLRAFISMLIGLSALILVNLTGYATGITIPISLTTVCVSSGLGIPGVTLLLFLNIL